MTSPGQALESRFDQRTQGQNGLSEPQLFTELRSALPALGNPPGVTAEIYHGRKSWIEFDPDAILNHQPKTCELADLLILSYHPSRPLDLRLTCFQAKYARKRLVLGPPPNPRPRVRADVYQWDLLARRRRIRPAGQSFQPPQDLLHSAVLPSIGSFGIFHDLPNSSYGLAYASADLLRPVNRLTPGAKQRTMTIPSLRLHRLLAPWHEVAAAPSMSEFGDALAARLIGTPLLLTAANAWDVQIGGWIRRQLEEVIEAADEDDDTELARNLVDAWYDAGMDPPVEEQRDPGRRPNILVVESEVEFSTSRFHL